jgi:hypothetical protein
MPSIQKAHEDACFLLNVIQVVRTSGIEHTKFYMGEACSVESTMSSVVVSVEFRRRNRPCG